MLQSYSLFLTISRFLLNKLEVLKNLDIFAIETKTLSMKLFLLICKSPVN